MIARIADPPNDHWQRPKEIAKGSFHGALKDQKGDASNCKQQKVHTTKIWDQLFCDKHEHATTKHPNQFGSEMHLPMVQPHGSDQGHQYENCNSR